MAVRSRSFANLVTLWRKIAAALQANAAELPELQGHGVRFVALLDDIEALSAEQGVHRAKKQDTSKRLQAALAQGRTLADVLVTGLRERYGNRNEKLIEYGLLPFRGRRSATTPTEPEPEAPTDPPDVE